MTLFPQRGIGTALARLAPEPKRLAPVTAKVENGNGRHELKSMPVMSYPVELFFDIARSGASVVTARNAMKVYALCYSCLRFRATKLAEPPLWIQEETNDGEKWLEGEHELSGLLELPNPDMEMAQFLDLVSLYMDTTGACLIVKNYDNGNGVASMYPFAGGDFSVHPTPGRIYGRFQVRTLTGTEWKSADDCIYLRNASPANLYETVNPTEVALRSINLGISMTTAVSAALRNAARPGGIITVQGELSTESYQRLSQEFKHNHEGAWNAGSTVLLEGGAMYNELKGSTLKEMSLGPLQEDIEAQICSAYQVHPVLVQAKVGVQATSGMSDSVKPLQDLFYDTVVIPRWGEIERAFTRSLLRPVDPDPRRFIKFDVDDVRGLAVDMTAKVQEAAAAVGFWLIDEQRAHTMLPPLPNNEGQVLAVDRIEPEVSENAQQAGRNAARARTASGQAAKGWIITDLGPAELEEKVATVFIGQPVIPPELVTKAWEAFDAKATKEETRYEAAALTQFRVESRAVVGIIEDAVPGFKADPVPDIRSALLEPYVEAALLKIAAMYAIGGKFYQQWVSRFRPLIGGTMGAGGDELLEQIGADFTAKAPAVLRAIQARSTKLSGFVTETTLQNLRDTIAKSRVDGVGISELSRRIKTDVFGDTISKSRATTIARTETVGALVEGEMLAAVSSGVFRAKKWISQRVGNSREEHIAEEDAGWVALDAPHLVTGKFYPHDGIGGAAQDVNCRCSELYTDLTPDEANAGGIT